MSFTNGRPFTWLAITPLIDNPYVEDWSFGFPQPPPVSGFIITEGPASFVVTESGEKTITE